MVTREPYGRILPRLTCRPLLHLGLTLCSLILLVASTGCSRTPSTGPVELKWDRDTCAYCRMVISDKGYATQVRGDPKHKVYKFDDIGCAVNWLEQRNWDHTEVELWVADYLHHDEVHWLDAHRARFIPAQNTPMDYGYGATEASVLGGIDFTAAMRDILHRDKRR